MSLGDRMNAGSIPATLSRQLGRGKTHAVTPIPPAARRWAATAAACAALALAASPPATAEVSLCAGGYLVSDLSLVQFDAQSAGTRPVETLPVPVNALGYDPAHDRYYAIASTDHGARVLAIDAGGDATDLGAAPAGTADAFAGAIHDGRWYLRARGDLHVVDVQPDSPAYLDVIDVQPLTRPVELGDWDVGADGRLYGVAASGWGPARLTAVEPGTGTVGVVGNTDLPRGAPLGAVVIDPGGMLHAFHGASGRMYHLDVRKPGASTFSDLGLRARTADAAGCPRALDFGDAPDSYRTTLANDGPTHSLDPHAALTLGATVDADADGSPSDGAAADDDDALAAPVQIAVGAQSVSVPVRNSTGAPATVAAWLDLNGDGGFAKGERVLRHLGAGDTTVSLHWSAGVTTPAARGYLRLRLYPGSVQDPKPTGAATGGEVEDYRVRFDWPKQAAPAVTPPPGSSERRVPNAGGSEGVVRNPARPAPKPTVQFVAERPEAKAPRESGQLPVPLVVFAAVMVPAIVVAARGIAARRFRR